jgi:peptidoglycan/xylan/chitin deacetylase (PgdA/CDA1 family)
MKKLILAALVLIFFTLPGYVSAAQPVPILMYHYIAENPNPSDTARNYLSVSPSKFEEQLAYLKNNGYTTISLDELYGIYNLQIPSPAKPVVLTFDDGYGDFYTDVFPILKKYHVKATQYVISGVIGKPNYMYDNQIKEIIRSGLVEIGAHTVHHVSLANKLPVVAKYEIQKSKSDLERIFNIKVVSFAYPNGSFDEQAIKIVKDAGYSNAVSTVPGIDQSQNNRFFLYRLRPGYKTGEELLNYLEQSKFSLPH